MAPAINAAHWLSADDSLTLPPWTRADDEHNEYETASSKRREFLRKTPLQDPIPYIIARDGASNAAPPVGDDLTSDSDGAESLSDSDSEEEEEKEEVKEEGTVTKDPVETTTPEAPPTTTSNISYTGDQKSITITPQNGIHSEVHKVLIGVGSVVGFILLLGLCLIAWKLTKRNRRRKAAIQRNLGFHKPSRGSALLNQFPFLKKRFGSKEWFTIPDPNHQNMAEKKLHLNIPTSTVRHETRFYSPDKPRGVAGLGIVNPVVAKSVATSNAKSVAGDVSPLSTTTNSNTPVDTGTAVAMTVTRHVPKPSVSSIQAQANNTMTSAYAPQPIYGPHRQTFYSDMSSLSSGFGDTDIIIPPPAPAATAPPQHHTSWHSSKSSGSGRRDTMYTEASEDTPARFRTVTSWVRQQTGRVKRAQEKDTPPVPGLPLEQEFGMMMPDGEVPRRVDMTMGGTAAY